MMMIMFEPGVVAMGMFAKKMVMRVTFAAELPVKIKRSEQEEDRTRNPWKPVPDLLIQDDAEPCD